MKKCLIHPSWQKTFVHYLQVMRMCLMLGITHLHQRIFLNNLHAKLLKKGGIEESMRGFKWQPFLEGMLMATMYPQVTRAILQKYEGKNEQHTLLI